MKFYKKLKLQRLKIVEQVIIITFFSLIVPLIVTGIIVNNINRQALAKELTKTADMLAKTVDRNIYDIFESDDAKIKEISTAIKLLSNQQNINQYLTAYNKETETFSNITTVFINPYNLPKYLKKSVYFDDKTDSIKVSTPISNSQYIVGTMNKEYLHKQIFKGINESTREIYVLSSSGKLISSLNYNEKDFQNLISLIPKNLENGYTDSIGHNHNQPIICHKMKSADIIIIVNTTGEITKKIIYASAWKILTAMIVSAIASILFVIMYLSYLYLNIRQLFKGITALSKGNYTRRIKLLKKFFTPYEIVFLSTEFNKAAKKIEESYSKLEQQNKELERLDNFRSNLIDTVSHEFRTPLTSIKGYTSRLMRHDIKIDEATLAKSLKIIKQQSERLSRMVEDLLVIPDIEGAKINLVIEPVNVLEAVEMALISVKNIENREVINNITEPNIYISADKDRFEQILINLIENANKYGEENTPLIIDVIEIKGKVTIILKNYAPFIDKKTIKTLFEKFVRLDDKMTRTTRGTGLGLFIVKGLLETMHGKIHIKSTTKNEFITYITLPSEGQN